MDTSSPIDGREVVARCKALGFALAGICDASPSVRGEQLRQWLDAGHHGEMDYLARNTHIRTDPAQLIDGHRAKAFVVVADQYASRNDAPDPQSSPKQGRIARYARGEDYHTLMKKRLHTLCDELCTQHPEHHFRAFVDTAPVPERELAARAGIGWIGKHTLVINASRGSYLLLGGIATTLDITPPPGQRPSDDHCGTCTRCIDACPTHAITERSVNASRCISYLTIEHRHPIDEALHESIGNWLFGCDICQEVCPHNSPRSDVADVGAANEAYISDRSSFDVLEVLNWTPEDRAKATRRSALKRAKLDMMKRNARIILNNSER